MPRFGTCGRFRGDRGPAGLHILPALVELFDFFQILRKEQRIEANSRHVVDVGVGPRIVLDEVGLVDVVRAQDLEDGLHLGHVILRHKPPLDLPAERALHLDGRPAARQDAVGRARKHREADLLAVRVPYFQEAERRHEAPRALLEQLDRLVLVPLAVGGGLVAGERVQLELLVQNIGFVLVRVLADQRGDVGRGDALAPVGEPLVVLLDPANLEVFPNELDDRPSRSAGQAAFGTRDV